MKLLRLPQPLHWANEVLAFLLELVMLGALAEWGVRLAPTRVEAVIRGLGAPLSAIVLWSLFAAPRAKVRLPIAAVLAVKVLVLASGAAAFVALGAQTLAAVFGVTAFVNTVIASVDGEAAMRAGRAAPERVSA